MSLRRYVNLVTANYSQGMYSLSRLNSDSFFYPANEAAAKARDLARLRRVPPDGLSPWMSEKKKKQLAALSGQQLESMIRPPRPIFNLRPLTCPVAIIGDCNQQLHSFPLSGTKILFADSGRRTTLYDTEARCAISTPCLHAPKDWPVALSVPSSPAGPEADGNSLYIMDTTLDPRNATPFEALVWRDCTTEHYFSSSTTHKAWHCDALPRPPFFDRRRPDDDDERASVLSYAVVGDVICVSLTSLGTYCTVSRTWSLLAGDWQMPFSGKAEYVPELKLWFGASAGNDQLPCAADLSPIVRGRAPKKQQRYVWGDPHLPADWLPDLFNPASIVSLGSGRFCIVNYFQDMKDRCTSCMGDSDGYPLVVFSGLEVLAANGNGDGSGSGLRMVKHKSRLCRGVLPPARDYRMSCVCLINLGTINCSGCFFIPGPNLSQDCLQIHR